MLKRNLTMRYFVTLSLSYLVSIEIALIVTGYYVISPIKNVFETSIIIKVMDELTFKLLYTNTCC